METDLSKLITQIINGDSQAFGTLISRYQKLVYGLAFHVTKNFPDAEDLTQEVFLEAYRNLHTLRQPEKFPHWIRAITVHLCNRWKKKHPYVVHIEDVEAEIDNISKTVVPTPEAELERKELSEAVMDAINSLPEAMGQVVILYYMDGMSYKEIAEFLELPVSTVKGRLQSSKKRLKKGMLKMVERTLHEQSPDEEFTKNTLERIFEDAKKANEQWNKSIFMEQCRKVSEMIDKLSDSDEKKEAEIRLLKMQADAAASWLGEPEDAYEKYERAYNLIKDRQQKDKTEEAKVLESLTQACANHYDYDKMKATAKNMVSAYKSIGDNLRSSLGLAFADVADMPSDADKSQNRFMVGAFSLKKGAADFSWQDVAAYRCRDFGKAYGMPSVANIFSYLFRTKTLLTLPTTVGNTWNDVFENDGHRIGWPIEEGHIIAESRIESDTAFAVTPAGEFQNCLKVVTVIKPEGKDYGTTFIQRTFCGARTVWFAPGVGIVKIRYCNQRDDSAMDVHLAAYEVNGNSKDYLPLEVGNWWRYQWISGREFNDPHIHDETNKVSDREGDIFYFSCAQWVSESTLEWADKHLNQLLDSARKMQDKWGEIVLLHDMHDLYTVRGREEEKKTAERFLELYKDAAEALARKIGRSGMDENQLIADIRNEMLALRKEAVDKYAEANESWLKAAKNIDEGKALEEAISSAQHAAALYQKMDMVEEVLNCENAVDFAKEKLRDLEAGVKVGYATGQAKRGRDAQTVFCEGSRRSSYPMEPPLDEYSKAAIADWEAFALDDIPLHPEVGQKWNDSQWNAIVKGESAVESIAETVTTPAGTFKDCMNVVSNFVANAEAEVNAGDRVRKACYPGERTCWFAKGVGLVKLEYKHQNGSITNLHLVEYSVKLRKDDYYPLDEDNWWRHEWTNDKGEFRFHQFSRVILKQQKEEKEIFNISFISHLIHKS